MDNYNFCKFSKPGINITIFKNEEITSDHFNKLVPWKYINFDNIDSLKNLEYGNFKELDRTKCKIDSLDKNSERNRRAAAKYLHEYELVKIICKKQVISRAYFKLYEMIFYEPLMKIPELNCFFICEAPGGFIECVSDIRRKRNLRMKYLSISNNKFPIEINEKKEHDIKYDKYLESDNLIYGDITDIEIIDNTIKKVYKTFPILLDFITADGGFDIKAFNSQELLSNKLILAEIYLALNTQRTGGMFIIKFFDMFTHNSIICYLILCCFYSEVKIIKPKTSRNSNSERYIICYSFLGLTSENTKIVNNIREVLIKYIFIEPFKKEHGVHTLIYPNFDFNKIQKLKQLINFNNTILYEQIKTINESIKMVSNRDTYFQSLILKLFIDKVTINYIFLYKNILYTRINTCIEWLRTYKINTHQLAYRFS
jgi:23S rRNA U2552 (ribose-2'-O)-methylase RlmE/FtsJ